MEACLLVLLGAGVVIGEHIDDLAMNMAEYHNYNKLTQSLKLLTHSYPNLTRVYSIGQSVQGRELWAIEISAGEETLLRPNVKLVANIHGDEIVGREILLNLAYHLVREYKGDRRVRGILDFARVHLLPSANPDGAEAAAREHDPQSVVRCQSVSGRKNRQGVDLNTDFPTYFPNKNTKPQKETQRIMQWMEDIPFVLSASLKGGALVAVYPYDKKNHDYSQLSHETPDHDVFLHIALNYSSEHPTMHLGQPCCSIVDPPCGSLPAFNGGIINGADWFPYSDTMQDYNYLHHGCLELTFEISCCKFPEISELYDIWDANREALLQFLGQVRLGVRGVVWDEGGVPVGGATLRVKGRGMAFHTTARGEYWRLLLPNTSYILEVEADGFEKQEVYIKIRYSTGWNSQIKNITLRRLRRSSTAVSEGQASEPAVADLQAGRSRNTKDRLPTSAGADKSNAFSVIPIHLCYGLIIFLLFA